MEIDVIAGSLRDLDEELVLVSLFQDSMPRSELLQELDQALGGEISELVNLGDFTGRFLQTTLIYPRGRVRPRRILIVGLGPQSEISIERLRQASAHATRKIIDLGLFSYASMVHGATLAEFPPASLARALVEGATMAAHHLGTFQSQPQAQVRDLARLLLVAWRPERVPLLMQGASDGTIHGLAANLARDLIASPANVMNTAGMEAMAVAVTEAAREEGLADRFSVQVLRVPELQRMNCGGILGVGQGSANEPRMVVLRYQGGEPGERPLALVGKGVPFDSGGLSLKSAESMEHSKYDKTGAAVVIAVLRAAVRLHLPLNLAGIIPLAENMPGGDALRPGDVLTMAAGLTVEVISTDAEGRLLLADALHYAESLDPVAIVDLATLTGGVGRTFAEEAIGILGNSARLMALLIGSGEMSNERCWPLPLWEIYAEKNRSSIADLKNSGGNLASTITAAKFLQRFVRRPWAHLDVFGAVWMTEDSSYSLKGPAGAGVRLLLHFLRSLADLKVNGSRLDDLLTLSRDEIADGAIPGVTEREPNVSLLALARALTQLAPIVRSD